jgi:hypothetical protein
MKKIIVFTLFMTLPMFLFAQKSFKCSYTKKKEYSAATDKWINSTDAESKFTINLKAKKFELNTDGSAKTYNIEKYTKATDDASLEDCYLIHLSEEKIKVVFFEREEKGIRIIKENGPIVNYYTKQPKQDK